MRHSASHCLAQAVERHYDDVDLAIGPPTDDGFYYDFDNLEIDEADLADLEAEIEEIVEADYEIEREDVSIEEAEDRLADEPYKLELLSEFADENEQVSFYRQGEWEDLCAGPTSTRRARSVRSTSRSRAPTGAVTRRTRCRPGSTAPRSKTSLTSRSTSNAARRPRNAIIAGSATR